MKLPVYKMCSATEATIGDYWGGWFWYRDQTLHLDDIYSTTCSPVAAVGNVLYTETG